MKLSPRYVAAALPLLLAACVHHGVRQPTTPPTYVADKGALLEQQRMREHALAHSDHWVLQGKLSVSNGKDGNSGTLTWTQDGGNYQFEVRGPITGKSFRLTVTADGAVLEGLDGGPRRNPDAETLMQQTLGWHVPLRDLRAWVLGLRAESGPGDITFGADGLPAQLVQDNWTVNYPEWDNARSLPIPNKVFAESPPYKVRLSVESWTFQ